MVKTVEQTAHNYARGSLVAFLDGSQSLNWIVAAIRTSGVRGERLAEVFDRLKGYGDATRYDQARSTCRQEGWLP